MRIQQLDPPDYVRKMFIENLIYYIIATPRYTTLKRNEVHAAIWLTLKGLQSGTPHPEGWWEKAIQL